MATDLWEEWLSTRPKAIREIARKYPPQTCFRIHGKLMWVISYGEYEDGLVGVMVTPLDPNTDYEAALEARERVCPCCIHNLDKALVKLGRRKK